MSEMLSRGCCEGSGWTLVSYQKDGTSPRTAAAVRLSLDLDPGVIVEPLIGALPFADVENLEIMASEAPDERQRPPIWLSETWRVYTGSCSRLARRLQGLPASRPELRAVWQERAASLPVNPGDDPRVGEQGWIRTPQGLDAREAWKSAGADGSGVALIDVESGWQLNHEDLVGHTYTLVGGANLADHVKDPKAVGLDAFTVDFARRHGANVLGVAVARDNQKGGVGLAPQVRAVLLSSTFDATSARPDSVHVARAILAAALHPGVQDGDVLLIEVQRGISKPMPVEVDPADLSAIRVATTRGLLVVEAAGNGSQDLDTWESWIWIQTGRRRFRRMGQHLNPASADLLDSGALMVGATAWNAGAVRHERLGTSNNGGRVDLCAPGDGLFTTGVSASSPYGSDGPGRYTDRFSGTSAASAVIAGAALCVQGAAKQLNRTLRAHQMLEALKAGLPLANNGQPPDKERIGRVPRLPTAIDVARKMPMVAATPFRLLPSLAYAAALVPAPSLFGPEMGWGTSNLQDPNGGSNWGEVYAEDVNASSPNTSSAITGTWKENWVIRKPGTMTWSTGWSWKKTLFDPNASGAYEHRWTSAVETRHKNESISAHNSGQPYYRHASAQYTYEGALDNNTIDQRHPTSNTAPVRDWATFKLMFKAYGTNNFEEAGRMVRFRHVSGSSEVWHEIWQFFDNYHLLVSQDEAELQQTATGNGAVDPKANAFLKGSLPSGRTYDEHADFTLTFTDLM